MAQRPRHEPDAPLPRCQRHSDDDFAETDWRLRGNGCWLPLYCVFVPVLLLVPLLLVGLAMFFEYP